MDKNYLFFAQASFGILKKDFFQVKQRFFEKILFYKISVSFNAKV